jgi:hypothetical protein
MKAIKLKTCSIQFIITVFSLLYLFSGCATKEDLVIQEDVKPFVPEVVLTPFERLQDSPTCVIVTQNYVGFLKPYQVPGVYGDIDLKGKSVILRKGFDTYSLSVDGVSNLGKLRIELGGIKKGIYQTSLYRVDKESDIKIEAGPAGISSITPPTVAESGQKVLVFPIDNTHVRIKFCKLVLFVNSQSYTQSITGEIIAEIQ